MATQIQQLKFKVGDKGKVSALLARPRGARWLYVCGHGAGSGMRHPFLEAIADRLAKRRIATFRYQFPYMEAGRKRPDHRTTLEETVRAAVKAATRAAPKLVVIAGGKSMGGRMTSLAASTKAIPHVRGLAFLGFPLHAAHKPGSDRASHLGDVHVPMLFMQGTRDPMAELELMEPVCTKLGYRATLHKVVGGDHSFKLLKRDERDSGDVFDEICDVLANWADTAL